MSQNLANDLPDKFGSSDEDEDDEEVVGWMGESGEFEPRARNNEEAEDEDDDIREFGRRGLFHERWETDFRDENQDEYEFRGLGTGLATEEHVLNVSLASFVQPIDLDQSSDEEDVDEDQLNPGRTIEDKTILADVSTSIRILDLDTVNGESASTQPDKLQSGEELHVGPSLPLAGHGNNQVNDEQESSPTQLDSTNPSEQPVNLQDDIGLTIRPDDVD